MWEKKERNSGNCELCIDTIVSNFHFFVQFIEFFFRSDQGGNSPSESTGSLLERLVVMGLTERTWRSCDRYDCLSIDLMNAKRLRVKYKRFINILCESP